MAIFQVQWCFMFHCIYKLLVKMMNWTGEQHQLLSSSVKGAALQCAAELSLHTFLWCLPSNSQVPVRPSCGYEGSVVNNQGGGCPQTQPDGVRNLGSLARFWPPGEGLKRQPFLHSILFQVSLVALNELLVRLPMGLGPS